MSKLRLSYNLPLRYWLLLITVLLLVNMFLVLKLLGQAVHLRSVNDYESAHRNRLTLATLNDLNYLIGKSTCENVQIGTKLPYFVIIIASQPYNFEMRRTIRQTWGHHDERVATYFALGASESSDVQRRIHDENSANDDLIQFDFIDDENNLTYKHMMALKWFRDTCSSAKYLVKMDDDVFANVAAIYEYLAANEYDKDIIMGKYIEPQICPRSGAHAVPREEYSGEYFPAYADGSTVIYSRDVVEKLCKKSPTSRFLSVDDVFVTGVLRNQLGLGINPLDEYILSAESLNKLPEITAISQ